jgi:hypothetical protein
MILGYSNMHMLILHSTHMGIKITINREERINNSDNNNSTLDRSSKSSTTHTVKNTMTSISHTPRIQLVGAAINTLVNKVMVAVGITVGMTTVHGTSNSLLVLPLMVWDTTHKTGTTDLSKDTTHQEIMKGHLHHSLHQVVPHTDSHLLLPMASHILHLHTPHLIPTITPPTLPLLLHLISLYLPLLHLTYLLLLLCLPPLLNLICLLPLLHLIFRLPLLILLYLIPLFPLSFLPDHRLNPYLILLTHLLPRPIMLMSTTHAQPIRGPHDSITHTRTIRTLLGESGNITDEKAPTVAVLTTLPLGSLRLQLTVCHLMFLVLVEIVPHQFNTPQ